MGIAACFITHHPTCVLQCLNTLPQRRSIDPHLDLLPFRLENYYTSHFCAYNNALLQPSHVPEREDPVIWQANDRSSIKPCSFYMRGRCNNSQCKFSHALVGPPVTISDESRGARIASRIKFISTQSPDVTAVVSDFAYHSMQISSWPYLDRGGPIIQRFNRRFACCVRE